MNCKKCVLEHVGSSSKCWPRRNPHGGHPGDTTVIRPEGWHDSEVRKAGADGKGVGGFPYYKAAIALAATLLPRGRVRSVIDRTTLGLANECSFISSDTCRKKTQTELSLLSTHFLHYLLLPRFSKGFTENLAEK